jgi:6-pyruvoyltetrahydropterin/6-carboxytetrahydropterin synthase
MWLEDNYDHKFLLWEQDELLEQLMNADKDSIVAVPFNPTAENLAKHLVEVVGPQQLTGTDCELIEVRVEETRKCLATYKKATNG